MILAGVEDVHRSYRRGTETIHALRGVSFELTAGEVVALMGPSGSGKSTLLNILCGWEHSDSGRVHWKGAEASSMRSLGWSDMAVVPQRLGLLEDLTANENIELPLVLRGDDPEGARQRVTDVMESLDIAHLSEKIPAETSLGEQQRICIGRALVSPPLLILADEPTGNQDHRREGLILNEFRKLASGGAAVLLATHDPRALSFCDRVISLHDGEIVGNETLTANPWSEDEPSG